MRWFVLRDSIDFHFKENILGCNRSPIIGVRYKCLECSDYDLCESCADRQLIHAHHVMAKIRTPHQVEIDPFVFPLIELKHVNIDRCCSKTSFIRSIKLNK